MRLVGPQQEPAWLEEGAVVAGYAIGRAVRRHPGAELRYAAQAADGTPVTLVTSRSPLSSRRERSRFRRLAEYRAALDHPTALAVHAVTERAGHPVLIMDRHPRSTFSDVLHADAPMRPERVVRMLAPVAQALDVAHAHGLIHQSLSADSLLLTRGDRLVLDSFGVLAPETDLTWSTIDAGELLYRAPEQLRGEPLDPRTNVYAFTGLLVHALTGEPPYAGDPPAVIYRHVAGAPPRVSERRPDLPAALDAVVEWGMAKEPFERPWSPTLLLDSVVEAVDVRRRPALVLRPAAPARVPRRAPTADPVAATPWRPPAWIGGNGWAATAAVMAALAVGALAGALADPWGDDTPAQVRPAETPAAWKRVAERRPELRDRLAAADTPRAQAAVATELSTLYAAAATSGGATLARAAREARSAYSRLAAAAANYDAGGYADAARAVAAAERRLAR